jgi:uncharacterized phage-like protein YoqJ
MRAKQSSCAFTGHRPEKLPWGADEGDARCAALKARIRDAVEEAYRADYTHFICGMARGCDMYFGEIVAELKEKYPDITLEAAIPCPEQTQNWAEAERARYAALLEKCDYETMVQDHYSPACMQRRNRYMVDRASLLVAAYDGCAGGTMRTIEYALSQGVSIVDIPIVTEEK